MLILKLDIIGENDINIKISKKKNQKKSQFLSNNKFEKIPSCTPCIHELLYLLQ
jgi:hypothetical protein